VINILSATIAVALSVTALTTAERTVQTESSAIKRFDQSLNKYLALKERLHREVPELRVTDRSEEIANRSDMLAGAIQRARGTARQAISSNHLRFPTTSAMATMPAHLLEALPTLPKDLEYRFAGRTLILRDRDAALIIDFLPAALPK
jgi:hypothetical protein